jgi:hypothetical protein
MESSPSIAASRFIRVGQGEELISRAELSIQLL